MVIAAYLGEISEHTGKTRTPRRQLRMKAAGAVVSGEAANVLIHNASATGLLIESDISLKIGEMIEIDLPHAGAVWAKVIWRSANLLGCQFDQPISAAALGAAQLQSAVSQDVSINARQQSALQSPDAEPFGIQIKRLRKERALTLSQVAAKLGVSKPTVWAWEQGKARPIDERIEALAEVLEVPSTELMSGPGTPKLLELIARCKIEIASAVGTSPEKIKVMIDL